jgi:pSer/pThr/pTyr-binding forkhead associated (FHA) protein
MKGKPMKSCPYCKSSTFDDMEVCYDCLHPYGSTLDTLPATAATGSDVARLRVALIGLFSYEVCLRKSEGSLLTVGCSSENNIVVPQPAVLEHHLDIFFSHGRVWAEDKGSNLGSSINGIPFHGTRTVSLGSQVTIADTEITLLSV